MPTRKPNVRRLLKLRRFLVNLGRRKHLEGWDLNTIATSDFKPKTCQGAACAMGWSPTIFPKLVCLKEDPCFDTILIKNPNRRNYDAMVSLFSITKSQAMFLFDCPDENTEENHPRTVIKRIDEILKHLKKSKRKKVKA